MAIIVFAFPALAIEVQEVKSPGGITAWLIEDHTVPLIAVRAAFTDAGATSDPQGKEGRAEMATELMFEGAGARDVQAFTRALEEHAIRMNVNVDDDALLASMQTLTEHKAMAFALLSDALIRPRLEPASIERMRLRTLTSIKSLEQSAQYAANRAFSEAAFPGHPYSRPAIGTETSVKALSAKDFIDYRTHYLTRENLIVGVAGDITAAELASLLDATFGVLPERFAPEHPVPEVTLPAQGATVHVERNVPQTIAIFALPGIKRDDADYMAAYVMNYALGGGSLTARLGKELREKRGLAYGADTALAPMLHGGMIQGSFATRAEQAPEAVRVMRQTIRDFAEQGITEPELSDAKRYITGSFVLNLDNNSELASWLISMQLYRLGRDYLERRNALIEAISREDVMRVSKRLLVPDALVIATAGKSHDAR